MELPFRHFASQERTCIPPAQPHVKSSAKLDSPALDVVTGLTEVKAATVDPGTTLSLAKQTMAYQDVRLWFVVSNHPCVDGLFTAADLLGDKLVRLVPQHKHPT